MSMFEATQNNRRNLGRQKLVRSLLGGMTAILILPVILIMATLVYKGAPVMSFDFLFTSPTNGMTAGGIFPVPDAEIGQMLLQDQGAEPVQPTALRARRLHTGLGGVPCRHGISLGLHAGGQGAFERGNVGCGHAGSGRV